jgi:hypothetical protein
LVSSIVTQLSCVLLHAAASCLVCRCVCCTLLPPSSAA